MYIIYYETILISSHYVIYTDIRDLVILLANLQLDGIFAMIINNNNYINIIILLIFIKPTHRNFYRSLSVINYKYKIR